MEIQWPLVFFTLLTGMGGWTLAFICAGTLGKISKRDPFVPTLVAFVLVVIGGFASVLHLSHPDRIMGALSHPTSGIFVEAVLVGIVSACAIVALICMKRQVATAAKVFAALAGIFGIVISFSAGQSYTVMTSHEAWDTILLPMAYLGTAIPMGAGLWWALCCRDEENGYSKAALCTGVAGIVGVVLIVAYAAVVDLFSGDGMLVALGAIACDVVVVVLAIVGKSKVSSVSLAWASFAFAALAGLCLRVLMWVVGTGAYGFFGQV